MHRKTLATAAFGLLAALAQLPAAAQTADELIAKNLQARGGRRRSKPSRPCA